MKNPLQSLQDDGQSVRLDDLRRSLITSGELGLPPKEITEKLLAEGGEQFTCAFAERLEAIDRSGKARHHDPMDLLRVRLLKELCNGQRS